MDGVALQVDTKDKIRGFSFPFTGSFYTLIFDSTDDYDQNIK